MILGGAAFVSFSIASAQFAAFAYHIQALKFTIIVESQGLFMSLSPHQEARVHLAGYKFQTQLDRQTALTYCLFFSFFFLP